jgi:hypothetical protein
MKCNDLREREASVSETRQFSPNIDFSLALPSFPFALSTTIFPLAHPFPPSRPLAAHPTAPQLSLTHRERERERKTDTHVSSVNVQRVRYHVEILSAQATYAGKVPPRVSGQRRKAKGVAG